MNYDVVDGSRSAIGAELLAAASAGDEAAWDTLVEHLSPKVWVAVQRRGVSGVDATRLIPDLAQRLKRSPAG